MEIKESEAEVVRWREACELEVEGGKKEMWERDKLVKFHSCLLHLIDVDNLVVLVVSCLYINFFHIIYLL